MQQLHLAHAYMHRKYATVAIQGLRGMLITYYHRQLDDATDHEDGLTI